MYSELNILEMDLLNFIFLKVSQMWYNNEKINFYYV